MKSVITIRIAPEALDELTEIAEQRRTTVAELARTAISEFLQNGGEHNISNKIETCLDGLETRWMERYDSLPARVVEAILTARKTIKTPPEGGQGQ